MLKTLSVTNFALIEQASVEFAGGLNILTGETGAGKSILVDALSTLLGSRAERDAIRSGCDSFRVEAVFDVAANANVRAILDDQGIPLEDGSTLIISRYLSRQGKTAILANGCHVTVGVLRRLGDELVDMHGQHEHQALLRPEAHLALVDSFLPGGREKLAHYRGLYDAWSELGAALARTETDSRERAQRLDMLTWQTQEIAAAALKDGEEEELAREIRLLGNAEKIIGAVSRAYGLLSEGGRGSGGALSDLAECRKELESAARFDPALAARLETISEAIYQLEDIAAELRDYRESVDFDPGRLTRLQERMDAIHTLKRKYGASIAAILEYYRQATAELADIANYEERLAALGAQRAAAEQELAQAAAELDRLRREAAAEIAGKVRDHLVDLGMPQAALAIEVRTAARFTPTGINEVAVLFSANPGEEPKPLAKVASGGELSRIALAFKTVAASADGVGTMIFDEVDAGIGGQTARMVAEKIALVAGDKQVLCVTHLPQVAAMADRHLAVAKMVNGDRTNTVIRILDDDAHLQEVTRMISGDNITRAALDNAAEMITAAKYRKEIWKNKAQA
ncbi:DNA repair protein RecN [Anaeroselena agilis]|uniref:DNA repair protein RecN n=1 Tax=Anaeroselena agilis TaxID=3063788 RepID=A0ABU3NW90_9FIRM|nr:DNA repair protein RecN [Selenomonadales bacterium 4137-cl]